MAVHVQGLHECSWATDAGFGIRPAVVFPWDYGKDPPKPPRSTKQPQDEMIHKSFAQIPPTPVPVAKGDSFGTCHDTPAFPCEASVMVDMSTHVLRGAVDVDFQEGLVWGD